MAWIDLRPEETLYLEVAEDYAVVATGAVTAVQVKDTAASGSVTLNSKSVKAAIQSFWNLQRANPAMVVRLRYLTTSSVGTENTQVFPQNLPGLHYWRHAAREHCNVEPLRGLLANLPFSDDLTAFLRDAAEEEIREGLLRRISWDCGTEDSTPLDRSIRDRLAYLGERFHSSPSDSERARYPLVAHLLTVVVRKTDRCVTRADLLREFERAVSVLVPLSAIRQIMSHGLLRNVSGPATAFSNSALPADRISELPLPPRIVQRDALVQKLRSELGKAGVLWLHGSSGTGKTVLAQLVARKAQRDWLRIDLRGLSGEALERRLRAASAALASSDVGGLIVDDFPVEQASAAGIRLSVLASEIRRTDASLIITSARSPSQLLRDCLSSDATPVRRVPYLEEDEVAELVLSAGGDAKRWARVVHVFCGSGHPQLVAARISGLVRRNWPIGELLQGVVPSAGPAEDVDEERTLIRTRLLAELSGDARELLYRLALTVGDFDRALAVAVGDEEPRLPRPGELLDFLAGPWVEVRAADRFRVSPLVGDAGFKTIPDGEQRRIHCRIVDQLLTRCPFPGDFLGTLLSHALIFRHEAGLTWLARAVICSGEDRRMICESLAIFPLLTLDKELFPENIHLSAMLRLAQFDITAMLNPGDLRLRRVADRLIVEARSLAIKDPADPFSFLAIGTGLMERSLAMAPSTWVPLLRGFETLLDADSDVGRLARSLSSVDHGLGGFTGPQFLFVSRATALTCVEDLSELFEQLGLLDAKQRDLYLSALDRLGPGVRMMINSGWVAEHDQGNIDWAGASVRFERLAIVAREWGHAAISAECYCAQAVMLDEHARNPSAALAALDAAEKVFPGEVRFARQRARIHYRNRDHEASLRAFAPDDQNLAWMDDVDRAFFLREAGISAAETGRLDEASQLFARAHGCAARAGGHMVAMAVGLLADRAVVEFKIGDRGAALSLLAQALEQAEPIDPGSGKREKWCLAILLHIVLWMRSEVGQWQGPQMPIVFGCGSNPEPSETIAQRPSFPALFTWYQLACLEVDLEARQGVVGTLRDRTAGGGFAVLELDLELRTISRAIRRGDAQAFVRSLPRYVSILAHLRAHEAPIEEQDAGKFPLAKIPNIDPKDWPDGACLFHAKDAILAFVATAFLADHTASYVELVSDIDSLGGARTVLRSLLDSIDNRALRAHDYLDAAGGCIATIAQERLAVSPGDMFWGTCNIWMWLKRSSFKSVAEGNLTDRLGEWWWVATEHQRFALRHPSLTIPAIRSALSSPSAGLAKIAGVLLAAEPAVDCGLSSEVREHLRDSLTS